MDEVSQELAANRRATVAWGIAFLAGTFGVAGASLVFDFGSALSLGLFFAAMLLIVPFARSAQRGAALRGCGSSALRTYNRRITIASLVYVVTLMGAVWLSKVGTYPTPVYVMIAVEPSFHYGAMRWARGRVLVEETEV